MVHPSTLGEGFDFPLRLAANDFAADPRACAGQISEICSAGAGVVKNGAGTMACAIIIQEKLL
jgi:hypothetical protein